MPLLSCILLAAPLSKADETGDILYPNTIQGTYEPCSGSDCWGGTSGGANPSWNGGTARWGYGGGVLSWTTAINTALQQAGLKVDGFRYVWYVKNQDANSSQGGADDYFRISVKIYDSNNNQVWGKQYNLDGDYGWTYFTGTETFNEGFPAGDLSNIIVRAESIDSGYWAGHYAGEFDVADSSLTLIYSEDPCYFDPLSSTTCPGYSQAYAQQQLELQLAAQQESIMNQITGTESSDSTVDDGTGGYTNDSMDTSNSGDTGMASTEETTGSSMPEAQTASTNSAGETTADAESSSQEASGSSSGSGRSLNANELNALAAAEAVAGAAVDVASEQAAVGSASGVESTMTSAAQSASPDAAGTSDIAMGGVGDVAGTGTSLSIGSSSASSVASSSSDSGSMGTMEDNSMAMSDTSATSMSDVIETEDITGEEALQTSQELTVLASVDLDLIERITDQVIQNTLDEIKENNEELSEKSAEEIKEENAQEDALAKAAMEGSTDEDAQAALLGYNPAFRAYNQVQLTDGQLYEPKEIYGGQQNYDNPNGRFFNGASDELHRRMIRSQYEQ